ncbi:hypothetical protein AAHS21_16385 [Mycobacterium sp. 050272]|uniref:hypothetical protein n=1 Tax=Mycobacterium sp. 050272 TaxID=3142488 RepID=UPI0031902687
MATDYVVYLAHHMLLLALPAFLPAVVVVAVILYAALKDRRTGRTDDDVNAASGTETAEDRRE